MYFFILHLSIADLLTALCTLLPEFVWTFTFPKFYAGNAGCKLMKYLFMVGPYLSSYTLVMTAVDRYQVRAHPWEVWLKIENITSSATAFKLDKLFYSNFRCDVLFSQGKQKVHCVVFSHVQHRVKQIGVGILKGS